MEERKGSEKKLRKEEREEEKSDDPALTFGRYYMLSGVQNIGLKINVVIVINNKCRCQCVVQY